MRGDLRKLVPLMPLKVGNSTDLQAVKSQFLGAWAEFRNSILGGDDRFNRNLTLTGCSVGSRGVHRPTTQHYRRWRAPEIATLRSGVLAGLSPDSLAAHLERTPDAIRSKCFLLGLTYRSSRHVGTDGNDLPEAARKRTGSDPPRQRLGAAVPDSKH